MLRILLCCFLLASAHDIPSTARPKRDLWSSKNLVSTKLFGSDTVVIQLPKIPKNETYQLFKIKGYDNIFLKVTRKPEKEKEKETEKPVKIKFEEPVMVSPEMAIIGNYLRTPTQRETLLALEIAKNLLKSGILRSEREPIVHEVEVPMAPLTSYKGYIVREPVKNLPIEVVTEERNPIFVDQPVIDAETINIVNPRPVAVYPAEYSPTIVAHEVKYRPFQTKYSYKQETEDADITYESYNNRGVIVTSANKVPVKPRYIALRFADVVSIAANPSLIRPEELDTSTLMSEVHFKEPLKVMPIHSYVTKKDPHTTSSPEKVEDSGYVDSYNFNDHTSSLDRNLPKVSESLRIPNFVKQSKLPFDIRNHLTNGEIDKLNKFINEKLDLSKNNENEYTPRPYIDENYSDGDMNNEQKVVPGDSQLNTSQINIGKIVSRYSYQQLGDEGHGNLTVRIEDPKLNQSEIHIVKSSGVIPQNYVYIPPSVYVPPPTPKTNNINSNVPSLVPTSDNKNDQSKYDDYESFNSDAENFPKTSVPITLRGDLGQSEEANDKTGKLKTNDQHLSTKKPIIVPEFGQKRNNVRTYKGGIKTSTGRPYTGGRGANNTSITSNLRNS